MKMMMMKMTTATAPVVRYIILMLSCLTNVIQDEFDEDSDFQDLLRTEDDGDEWS
jgi:hypothetical protein